MLLFCFRFYVFVFAFVYLSSSALGAALGHD